MYTKRASKRKSSSPPPSGNINVKTVDENGMGILFSLKPTTPLQKLMQAYCNRRGMDMKNLRFIFYGKPLQEKQTPAHVYMEDGDIIHVEVVL